MTIESIITGIIQLIISIALAVLSLYIGFGIIGNIGSMSGLMKKLPNYDIICPVFPITNKSIDHKILLQDRSLFRLNLNLNGGEEQLLFF